ncbi:MAG TPA: DUF86 domain-containing protein [Chloroflexi bacterium]|nr:DUF86 domain-containing protein [Chloroflexota bacterium]
MNGVDRDKVRTLLGRIAEAQERAAQLGDLPEEEFLSDFRNTESAKYLLLVAIEAALDLCQHLAVRGGGRAPESYADCFTVLQEMGVLPEGLAGSLRRMARFRNLLVHLYWEVDDRRVYHILRENLDDLTSFREVVARWVTSRT